MIRTVTLGLALVAATAGATPSKPGSAPKSVIAPKPNSADAPADEYFGPFKYSAISVRTKINALGRSYRERWADDASIVHDAQLVESSFRAWAQKYPKDTWIAPTAYHLAQLYQDVQTQDARNHARAMYEFLVKNYPASKEAHSARVRLSHGFPPLHAESPVSPTPSPYGPASPVPEASPGASTAPATAPSGAPVTAPSGTPPTAPSAAPKPAAPSPAVASPKPSAKPTTNP